MARLAGIGNAVAQAGLQRTKETADTRNTPVKMRNY